MKKWGKQLLLTAAAAFLLAGCSDKASGGDEKPKTIKLDYAYYSPTSLVLKKFGWAEKELKKEGIKVEWVQSQGSNKALEFLNSKSVDFGSTAGAAAFIAKSKGAPIESVYIFSQPEWTALVTKSSSISSVKDLKGKKIAATIGTDPYIFLLRALQEEGLSSSDVEIVNLQHQDGANALLTGQVDAWAGLDPHMAKVELESGGEFLYRNPEFNTYGTLNVRSAFAENYPEYVEKVIALYEKARKWTDKNPDEAAEILSKESGLSLDVARKQLERNNFEQPIPGDDQIQAISAAGEVLKAEKVISPNADIEKLVNELINPSYAKRAVK
ncbi:aliphatic sulfonate ABC transporter substrate-binding protein [Fictibacillus iocasae]|uniref:Aliphatic sulfonate ABC transporter substrate-binding protein n=1 Tax=Fictibacillus iocasae TaxID=2715437 RepID=A0ABW2NL87_9BACL